MAKVATCKMKKETAVITVNKEDQEKWEAKGFTHVSDNDATASEEQEPTTASTGESTTTETDASESDESGDNGEPAQATDAALKLANDEGVDLSEVTGTGTDGKITKGDVEAYIQANG